MFKLCDQVRLQLVCLANVGGSGNVSDVQPTVTRPEKTLILEFMAGSGGMHDRKVINDKSDKQEMSQENLSYLTCKAPKKSR